MADESRSRMAWGRLTTRLSRHLTPLLEHGSWSLAFGLFLALALVLAVRRWLEAPDLYPEPVSGLDAWKGYAKAADFRAVYLLLIAGTLFAGASAWVVARVAGTGERAIRRRSAAREVLLVASLPAIAWLARLVLAPQDPPSVPTDAGLWLLVGHVAVWIVGGADRDLEDTQLRHGALTLLGGAFVAQFAGAAFGMLASRIWPQLEFPGTTLSAAGWGASAATLVAATWTARRARGDIERFQRTLVRLTLLCHLPLPLLCAGLVPPPFASPFGGMHNEARWPLLLLAAVIAAAAMAAWVRSWRALRRAPVPTPSAGEPSYAAAFSPLPLAALALFLSVQHWNIPVLPVDDWHFGERWVPWQQWAQFGKVPFVDTMPTFGFYGSIVGTLAKLGFEPTIAGWLGAEVVLKALLAGGCCLGAFAVGGPAAALFVLLWPAFTDRLMLFAPCVLALAAPALLARPLAWLLCWPAACLLATAFNPASGVALTAASVPVAAWVAWRGWRQRSPTAVALLVWAVLAVLACIATPAWGILRGFLDYVRSNSELYAVHAGTAVALGSADSAAAPEVLTGNGARLLWLAGWIAVAVLLAAIVARELVVIRERASGPDLARVALGWMTVGGTLLLLRWAVTRVAPDGWTRAGVLTFTCLSALLPPLLLRGRDRRAQIAALAVLTALLAPFALVYPARSSSRFLDRVATIRALPNGQTVVDGAQIGLPALGTVAVEDRKHLALLQEMRRLLDAHTRPGDPIFDLANRPAVYAHTGRAMAARYSSGYYLANDRLQRQVLSDLRRTPPAAVLFAPAITHGEGPATIRSYRVAKHLLLNYRPVELGDVVLLLPAASAPGAVNGAQTASSLPSREQLTILDRVIVAAGEQHDHAWLGLLPATWGRSWSSMAESLHPGSGVRVTDANDRDDRTWGMEFEGSPVAGRDVDYLKLDIAWIAGTAPGERTIDLAWSVGGREPARPLRCALPTLDSEGRSAVRSAAATPDIGGEARAIVVIPVGSHPRWLFAPMLEGVVARPTTEGMLSTFRVLGAAAYRLRD